MNKIMGHWQVLTDQTVVSIKAEETSLFELLQEVLLGALEINKHYPVSYNV